MAKMLFKLTWSWGGRKEFPDRRSMIQWRSEHEDEIGGMFGVREYVLGVDGQWYELAVDSPCPDCGA